jgi:glycogen operon protein
LLQRISDEPLLKNLKLIAEPWDPGPGGYQLGRFPAGWAEWNDRFRDSSREFWRSGEQMGEFARRLHGSADLFEPAGRAPWASVNFVSSHDGFTLTDLVSYEQRHNQANGEDNRDGHAHNLSCNYGIEGPSNDPAVLAARRQHRLNLLCSLLLSQGTPMLLAGDEFGNSQGGNNNAYAQDNESGWLDWSQRDLDPDFTDCVRALLALRRNWALFRQHNYVHSDSGRTAGPIAGHIDGHVADQATGLPTLGWFHPDGSVLADQDWSHATALMMVLNVGQEAAVLMINSTEHLFVFHPPGEHWAIAFASSEEWPILQQHLLLPGRSCAVLVKSG